MIDLYQILEVESSASSSEIKKAYRRLALKYHPDKVSEQERVEAEHKFKQISHAYEVLIDEHKRYNYDTYGTDEDVPGYNGAGYTDNSYEAFFGAGPEFKANDFHNFFSGMNNNQHHRPKKTDDAILNVEINLEDLYNGKTIRSTSTRNVICNHCKGTGARKNASARECGTCNGEGKIPKLTRTAPGYVSQTMVDCKACHGAGKIYRHKDLCKKCKGQRVVEETKILEFEIIKGSKSEDSIVLSQESDQYPGMATGDVILKYTCRQHKIFERKDNDLYCKMKISLADALCGFTKVATKHLDGRDIKISTPLGKVIRPGDFIKINNEGLPKRLKTWFGNPNGDLYIETEVEFPADNWFLEKNDLVKLRNVLPNDTKAPVDEDEENIELVSEFTVLRQTDLPSYVDHNDHRPDYQAENECKQQ